VSLGSDTYLEFLAPVDGAQDAELSVLASPTPIAFALRVSDVAAVRSELSRAGLRTTDPARGSRLRPDGVTIQWTTFEIVDPALGDLAPFFIQWESARTHPAHSSPGGCALVSVDLSLPTAAKLAPLRLAANIHVRTGAAALAFTLDCGGRTVRFTRDKCVSE
jgi:hypothetical protein